MNYGQLKTLIMQESHRHDLTAAIPGFIRRTEGMIARSLRAVEMVKRVELDESARIAGAMYDLPFDFIEERYIHAHIRPLVKVGIDEIHRLQTVGVRFFALGSIGTPTVYFKGTPGDGAVLDMEYYARPVELTDDADTNAILAKHESLYLHGSLFHLYFHTQDLELAQSAADIFNNTVETLNEQAGRYFGGARTQAGYNLGNFRTSGGY
jgi:hypothetical protein